MSSRTTYIILACALICALGFLVLLNVNTGSLFTLHARTPKAEPTLLPVRALPKHLIIPKIGVDAPIEPVGLTGKLAMNVPADPMTVGWLATHPSPGEEGNAVMDGHRGWKNRTAVFDNLHELLPGDMMYVETDTHTLISFKVRRTKVLMRDDDTTEIFKDTTGVHLNIITCDGAWDAQAHTYVQRFVVFADEVRK